MTSVYMHSTGAADISCGSFMTVDEHLAFQIKKIINAKKIHF